MKSLRLPNLLLIPALVAAPLASASVVLVQDNRFTSERPVSPAGPLITYTPTTPFSTWQSSVIDPDPWYPGTTQLQNSQVTSSSMTGTGMGFSNEPTMAEPYHDFSAYNSTFGVKFSVQQTQILTLSFALTASPFGASSSSNVFLQGPAGFDDFTAMVSTEANPFAEENFDYFLWGSSLTLNNLVFTLAPGEYALSVYTSVDPWTTSGATWDFNAQFVNEVPLPPSGWMLLSSLGSLAIAQRARRRREDNPNA